MISKKLLRKLPVDKTYIVFDSLYNYMLSKYKDGNYRIKIYGFTESIYICEKDLEWLTINARDNEELYWHYKNNYIYNGHTNHYRAVGGIGLISNQSDFYGFSDLCFFGEYKDEKTIETLNKFRKTLKRKGQIRLY